MNHTPGPWFVGPDLEICHEKSGCNISRSLRITSMDGRTEEDLANANLISAAPDLLEALQALYDHQNGCPLPSYEEGWTRAMSATESALKKARGKK